MNIFKILASGDGSINEPNISAFLGYLLDPNQDHGLGYVFIERFLKSLSIDEDFEPARFEYKMFYEQAFKKYTGEKKNIVDIVLVCYQEEKSKGTETKIFDFFESKKEVNYIFIIENKIKVLSKKNVNKLTEQLKNEMEATINTLKNKGITQNKIISIYLTPDNDTYTNAFKSFLTLNKYHVNWKSRDKEIISDTVYNILQKIIEDESNGNIETINIYIRSTIVAFLNFIKNDFKSELDDKKNRKNNGAYTLRYINLNKETKIFEKLEKLREEILLLNTKIIPNDIKVDMKKPRFPRIKVNLEDYNIDIHAGSEFRDRVGFIYRIKGDKNNREKSLKKLRYIVKTLNIDCIKNEKSSEAYCRTEQMLKERYMIDNVHLINTKLNELIEKAK